MYKEHRKVKLVSTLSYVTEIDYNVQLEIDFISLSVDALVTRKTICSLGIIKLFKRQAVYKKVFLIIMLVSLSEVVYMYIYKVYMYIYFLYINILTQTDLLE